MIRKNSRYGIYTFFSVILSVCSIISRNLIPFGADYIILICWSACTIILLRKQGILIPKRYGIILGALIIVYLINASFSEYPLSGMNVGIAIIMTIIPFLVFILSYNYLLTERQIIEYMESILKMVGLITLWILLESVIHNGPNDGYTLIGSSVFMIGFYASLCNIATIIALSLYYYLKNKRYLIAFIVFTVALFLTMQLKALIGGVLIVVIYYGTLKKTRKSTLVILMILCLVPMLSSDLLKSKLSDYSSIYLNTDAKYGVARVALFDVSFRLASDYFPFGAGVGTFGSPIADITRSRVYEDYDIEDVWGISYDGDVDFRKDTHWATVIGEQGVIGTILYLLLFFYPLISIYGKHDERPFSKISRFVIISSTITIFIESLTLSIPTRMAFIIVYAGLNAMMLKENRSYKNACVTDNN